MWFHNIPVHLFRSTVFSNEKKEGARSHIMRFVCISYMQRDRLLWLFILATPNLSLIENSMRMWHVSYSKCSFSANYQKALESSSSVRYHSVWLTHRWTLLASTFPIYWIGYGTVVLITHRSVFEPQTLVTNFKWEKLCCGYMRG